MSLIDEQLERLIVRHLDGALSAEEERNLQRELIRNPAARQLAEEYARVDRLAGAALHDALVRAPAATLRLTAATAVTRRRWTRGWLFVPGAMAAALLAMVVPYPGAAPSNPKVTTLADRPITRSLPGSRGEIPRIVPSDPNGVMRSVSDSPWLAPRTRRDTGRELIGVQGDDGNIYWLEISRTRTVRQPERATATLPVTESL